MVYDAMKDPSKTLQDHDHHFFFNHVDITTDVFNVVEDYVKQEWEMLGFKYGKMLLDAAAHEHPHADAFLQ